MRPLPVVDAELSRLRTRKPELVAKRSELGQLIERSSTLLIERIIDGGVSDAAIEEMTDLLLHLERRRDDVARASLVLARRIDALAAERERLLQPRPARGRRQRA